MKPSRFITNLTLSLTLALLTATNVLAKGPKGPTVVDVAIEVNSSGTFAGAFDTLIAAVSCSGQEAVLEYLSGNGQRTVFAPTDDAFAALGLDENNVCGALDSMTLSDILQYHVAKGRRTADLVVSSDKIRMLFGGFLDVYVNANVKLIDNLGREAMVIATDVEAANGVIHAIDAVVLPYDPNA